MGKKYSILSPQVKKSVWNKTNGKCWYCGKDTILPSSETWASNDHFVVEHVDNLGGDDIENLVPSCAGCNRAKKRRSLEEFRDYLSSPKFDDRQVNYLRSHGIEIPKPKPYIFYGETL